MYAEIKCPECYAEANVDQIDLRKNQAQCHACGHMYTINASIQKIRNKVRVQVPKNWETTKSINHSELSVPMSTNVPVAMLKVRGCFEAISIIPALVAIVFIAVWIVGFTKQSIEREDTLNMIVGLIFSCSGLAFLFWILFTKKKRMHTIIKIDDTNLIISLPNLNKSSTGKTQFPVIENSTTLKSDIKQLYVIKSGFYYKVLLLNADNEIKDFFYPFFNLDHALYVEQSIEDMLGIKDKYEEGEIKL